MDRGIRERTAQKIGRRLHAARELRGLDLREVASRSSIEIDLLQRYEAGRSAITIDELEKVAAALRFPIGHFLDGCVLCGSD